MFQNTVQKPGHARTFSPFLSHPVSTSVLRKSTKWFPLDHWCGLYGKYYCKEYWTIFQEMVGLLDEFTDSVACVRSVGCPRSWHFSKTYFADNLTICFFYDKTILNSLYNKDYTICIDRLNAEKIDIEHEKVIRQSSPSEMEWKK